MSNPQLVLVNIGHDGGEAAKEARWPRYSRRPKDVRVLDVVEQGKLASKGELQE